jgi:hypothetical protein
LADDAELDRLVVESGGLEAYRAGLGTEPRVYYKNLYKWEKVFVSGSAVYRDTDECAEGAGVTVTSAGVTVGEGVANNYSEFVVDRLEPGKEYVVTVEASGYKPYATTVKPETSINLGTILLERV